MAATLTADPTARRRTDLDFGGAVGTLLEHADHGRRCYWDFRVARWVCPRRPQPPG